MRKIKNKEKKGNESRIIRQNYIRWIKQRWNKKQNSKCYSKSIDSVIENFFGWGGEGKKHIESLVKPFLNDTLENYDFSNYTTKLQAIIKDSLENSKLELARKNILAIIGTNTEEEKTISLQDLFKEYCDYIESLTFDHDDVDADEGKVYVECKCIVEEKGYSYKYYKVKFTTDIKELTDNEDEDDHTISFEIRDGHKINYEIGDMKVNDLRYMGKVKLHLLNLYMNDTLINDIKDYNRGVACEVDY